MIDKCAPPFEYGDINIAKCQCVHFNRLKHYNEGPVGEACKKILAWYHEQELKKDKDRHQFIIDTAKELK